MCLLIHAVIKLINVTKSVHSAT